MCTNFDFSNQVTTVMMSEMENETMKPGTRNWSKTFVLLNLVVMGFSTTCSLTKAKKLSTRGVPRLNRTNNPKIIAHLTLACHSLAMKERFPWWMTLKIHKPQSGKEHKRSERITKEATREKAAAVSFVFNVESFWACFRTKAEKQFMKSIEKPIAGITTLNATFGSRSVQEKYHGPFTEHAVPVGRRQHIQNLFVSNKSNEIFLKLSLSNDKMVTLRNDMRLM